VTNIISKRRFFSSHLTTSHFGCLLLSRYSNVLKSTFCPFPKFLLRPARPSQAKGLHANHTSGHVSRARKKLSDWVELLEMLPGYVYYDILTDDGCGAIQPYVLPLEARPARVENSLPCLSCFRKQTMVSGQWYHPQYRNIPWESVFGCGSGRPLNLSTIWNGQNNCPG
jgi:hypothetical protein